MPATDIDLRGDNPLGRAREHLKLVDLDPERVRRVRVVVEYDEGDGLPFETEGSDQGPSGRDEPGEKSSSPEVERGPVEPDPDGRGGGSGWGDAPGEHAYKGPRWEGAVTPDSNRGVVLRNMVDGAWYSRDDVAGVTDLSTDQVGRAMADLFRDYGYTERRGNNFNREYRITDEGRVAINKGIRKARAQHDEPDFVDDATEDGETICRNCGGEHNAAYTRCPNCGTPA